MKSTSEICPQCQVLSSKVATLEADWWRRLPRAVGGRQEEFRDVVEASFFGHRQAEAAGDSRRPTAFPWRPTWPRPACTRTIPARASHGFCHSSTRCLSLLRRQVAAQPNASSRRPTGRYRGDAIDHRTAHVPRVLVRSLSKAVLVAAATENRPRRFGRPAPHGAHRVPERWLSRILFDDPDVSPRLCRRHPVRSTLANTIHKVSVALDGPYDELLRMLPTEMVLNIDETGHKCNKELWWTWCLRAEMTCSSRSTRAAAATC